MAEASRQTALSGHIKTGEFGLLTSGTAGINLSERQPSAIAQVNGAPEEPDLTSRLASAGLKQPPTPNRASNGKRWDMLWNGRGQWLVVSTHVEPEALLTELESALESCDATVTDLSHARSVCRIEGIAARELMAKLCPLDIEIMKPGDCATSLIGQLTAAIHCVDTNTFDLYVFRSFGLAMWETLIEESLEFGVRVA